MFISPLAATESLSDSATRRAMEYVDTLDDQCAREDGYGCLETVEIDLLAAEADAAMLPGNYLRAWQASYQDFIAIDDLVMEQKALRHYKFGFTQDVDYYIVHYRALLLPSVEDDGEVSGLSNVTYGRTTRYWIDKKSFEVSKRLFYR